MNLKFLGHSSFKIKTNENRVIYIDPYAGEDYEGSNLILVSNSNYDHSSRDKIKKIRHDNTEVITTKENAGNINGIVIIPGQDLVVDENIDIKCLRAESDNYHDAVGFLLKVDNIVIYFAGATKKLENVKCDVALIPVGSTHTLTPTEASQDIRIIKPKIVIPMHFGDVEGTLEDAEHFSELLSDVEIKVLIMKENEDIDF